MIGYDIDGVLTKMDFPEDCNVVISGRTVAEYDDVCKRLAQHCPVYIRGAGSFGDREAAGEFKAVMVSHLGVRVFHEDDPVQAEIIKKLNPSVEVILHK